MGYRLREGLSFCLVEKRPVFLDLANDRYFGLEPWLGEAFALATSQPGGPADAEVFRRLAAEGLLRPTPGDEAPAPWRAPPLPQSSLLDAGPADAAPLEHGRAAIHLMRVAVALRRGHLAALIARLARLKAGRGLRPTPSTTAAAIAAVYERLALVTAAHDKCLWRSLAIARHLIGRGIDADLVLGVRLRPFAAHCWVQVGAALVNDRVETVATFTPIRSA